MGANTNAERVRLTKAAVDDLRLLQRLPEDERASVYKRVADSLVALRSLYTTKEGHPDWRGQSWQYRQDVGEIYREAGLPPTGTDPIKTTLRYHIGNALRRNLTEDELREVNLLDTAPKDRIAWRYREGANLAELAKTLVYRIVRAPGKPPEPEVLDGARKIHQMLTDWLRQHGALD